MTSEQFDVLNHALAAAKTSLSSLICIRHDQHLIEWEQEIKEAQDLIIAMRVKTSIEENMALIESWRTESSLLAR